METYKGITLTKFKGGECKLTEQKFRQLNDDEVLIKVYSATILPADLAFLEGTYGNFKPTLPRVVGQEGSGTIEKVGKNIDEKYIGKRCGVVSPTSSPDYHGLWSEYTYTKFENLIVFDKEDIDFDLIASSQSNPLTACGFIDTVKNLHKKNSCAQNCATTSLGKIFIKLCVKEGIELINIVRKESSIEELKSIGGKHFVVTSKKGWEDEFKRKCEELDVSILFDASGGEYSGKALKGLKKNGVLYHYGNMELKRLSSIDPNDLIFGKKRIKGWWLLEYMKNNLERFVYWKDVIKNDFEHNNAEVFSTNFIGKFSLKKFEEGFGFYLSNSGGKVLLKPWD